MWTAAGSTPPPSVEYARTCSRPRRRPRSSKTSKQGVRRQRGSTAGRVLDSLEEPDQQQDDEDQDDDTTAYVHLVSFHRDRDAAEIPGAGRRPNPRNALLTAS